MNVGDERCRRREVSSVDDVNGRRETRDDLMAHYNRKREMSRRECLLWTMSTVGERREMT